MKQKILTAIFIICAIFILMGVATILKGDIENAKEALIMAAYLFFFLSAMLIIKWPEFGRMLAGKY
ncbi:MAG TPA: hypothetical protein VK484_02445 [Ferruginibacter sp.]|nr:hypothetical protein [Ferruginibacter sp.]